MSVHKISYYFFSYKMNKTALTYNLLINTIIFLCQSTNSITTAEYLLKKFHILESYSDIMINNGFNNNERWNMKKLQLFAHMIIQY